VLHCFAVQFRREESEYDPAHRRLNRGIEGAGLLWLCREGLIMQGARRTRGAAFRQSSLDSLWWSLGILVLLAIAAAIQAPDLLWWERLALVGGAVVVWCVIRPLVWLGRGRRPDLQLATIAVPLRRVRRVVLERSEESYRLEFQDTRLFFFHGTRYDAFTDFRGLESWLSSVGVPFRLRNAQGEGNASAVR
jgi:hypothetical protein